MQAKRVVRHVFSRLKERIRQPQEAIPPAAVMAAQCKSEAAARAKRNQRQFDHWLERKLIPAVNRYLEASKRGEMPWEWRNRTYRSTSIRVSTGTPGVSVTTFVKFIHPVLETRYRSAGYKVKTEVITEVPEFKNGRFTGKMNQRPAFYITTITYGGK